MWGANGIQIRFAESMLLHFILLPCSPVERFNLCPGVPVQNIRIEGWGRERRQLNKLQQAQKSCSHVQVQDVDSLLCIVYRREFVQHHHNRHFNALRSSLLMPFQRLSENLDDLMLSFHVTDSPDSSFMFSWHCSITLASFKQSNVKIEFPQNAPLIAWRAFDKY